MVSPPIDRSTSPVMKLDSAANITSAADSGRYNAVPYIWLLILLCIEDAMMRSFLFLAGFGATLAAH